MSKLIFSAICCLFFIGGCQSMPKSVDEAAQMMDKLSQIAEKNGAAWNGTLKWDGTIGPEHSEKVVIDTGVTFEFSAHGNAASERQSVSNQN